MGWLTQHLEEFVYPYIGRADLSSPIQYFKPEEKTIIKNTWRAAKHEAKGKTILLAGRDVFIFEILAKREGYPTLFYPACSRSTVLRFKELVPKNVLFLDTGFMGSIPISLKISTFKLLSYIIRESKIQVFPRLSGSRHIALRIEATPKYWKCGHFENGIIKQELSDREEFSRAAALTHEIYTDSSPRFIPRHKPLQGRNLT